jgi:predicted nucleic acid-binding Zn ribbon protein
MKAVRTMDGTIMDTRVDSGRYCLRCGASIHWTEHLCKDIVARMHEENQRDWSAYQKEITVIGGEG